MSSASPRELVEQYLQHNYRIVIWPPIGDLKGPRETGWPQKTYTLSDYRDGNRVGIMTGIEVAPGRFLHDVDIDWSPGSVIAQKLLPSTGFVFGRPSKRISHCFYTCPEALPSSRYEDVDGTCLIELRGTKSNGELGLQTMVPPSVWSKEGQKEPLIFVKQDPPALVESQRLRQTVCLSAIGMLLAKHLGQNGFGHDPRLCWAGFLLRAGISVDELVAMGEGISTVCNNLEVHDVRTVVESTAARLKDPKQKIKGGPALARLLGDKGKAVVNRINEWLGRESDFLRNADGLIIKDNQINIRRAIQMLDIQLSYNEFSERMMIQEPGQSEQVVDDATINSLWLRVDRDFHFRPSKQFFDIVIQDFTRYNEFHPVRDYLASLTWDGVPRIDEWLIQYAGAKDSPFVRAVSGIVLMAAVRRVRQPGCKYDEMLVLESPTQGYEKSTALRALAVKDEWFTDDLPLNVDAKLIMERTIGKWIIESSDLSAMRKADRDHLKSMLSRQIDGPARMAYAHFPVERPRQFIIIGTTNNSHYLADMTGARRFWPVEVQRFDVKGIIDNRDQLWAEAAHREAKGESIRLPESLWDAAAQEQEERREIDAWEMVMKEFIDAIIPTATGRRQVSAQTIWEVIQPDVTRRDTVSGRRISEIMQRFGFRRTRIWEDGKSVIGYVSDKTQLDFDDE